MKQLRWYFILVGTLLILSSTIYYVQVVIFRKIEDTFFYMFQNLAFVPIQVLLATFIISGLLNMKEKRVKLEKLNMVISVFFSEAGIKLLAYFSDCDPRLDQIRKDFIVTDQRVILKGHTFYWSTSGWIT